VLQFEVLEKKVDKLIDVCKTYETTNLELTEKINRLEEELQARVEAEKTYKAEKAEIRSKIDHLLSRLEDFSDR
jgi:protein-arginine kinase activator protein McsA